MARKKPWYSSCKWSVEAHLTKGPKAGSWQPIYCSGSKRLAKIDAKAWKESTGQKVRVVPGPGHKTRRDL